MAFVDKYTVNDINIDPVMQVVLTVMFVACVSGQDTVHYQAANVIRNSHYTYTTRQSICALIQLQHMHIMF